MNLYSTIGVLSTLAGLYLLSKQGYRAVRSFEPRRGGATSRLEAMRTQRRKWYNLATVATLGLILALAGAYQTGATSITW